MRIDTLTGPVARVLRSGPGNLFRYRADLHDRLTGLLEGTSLLATARAVPRIDTTG
jgi:hypothetical protein